MNRVKYRYEVLTELRLSAEEIAALTELCDGHYDSTVRGLSTPGLGAVINGARVTLGDGDGKFATIRVTHRQLDLLCKATESVRSVFVDRSGDPTLHDQLVQLLRDSNAEWVRLNPDT